MPQYEYPIRLRQLESRIAIPTFPIEVTNCDGKILFISKEKLRFFSANSLHVFLTANPKKQGSEKYQLLNYSEKGIDRGVRFLSIKDQRAIGKILQHKRNGVVLIEIFDSLNKLVASTTDNVFWHSMDMIKSVVFTDEKKLQDSASHYQFRTASHVPVFSITPHDLKGSIQLTLESVDVTIEHEECILLGMITLMFWLQHDKSAGS
jgi:hypothetical protein